MTIDKGVWTWTGIPSGPGYSIFYATPDMGLSGDIKTFFESIKNYLPSSVTIESPSSGDRLDEATGMLTGVWSGGVGGSTVGLADPKHSAPAGASVTWLTAGIVNGKRVRGRTFLVPLSVNAYQADGTLDNTAYGVIQSAADALVASAAGDLLVWHRPVAGAGGSAHPVTGAKVSDRVSILTSRRG